MNNIIVRVYPMQQYLRLPMNSFKAQLKLERVHKRLKIPVCYE